MNDWRCGAVVIARNEEKSITKCLESLRDQTVKVFLVVVNDGSIDRTGEAASRYADVVVDLPFHAESWVGMPQLARVFNAGFNVLKHKNIAYIMISGADVVYPLNYIEEIIKRMEKGSFVLASGVAEGEVSRSLSPRGSGRVIEAKWFRSIGFKYPENYGFEVYLVYKALSQGKRVIVFSDLKFKLSRKTVLSQKKLFHWGKGMKALNYWWVYALGRSILTCLMHPLNGFAMLKGYVSNVSMQYGDIKEFVPALQKQILKKRLGEIFRL